MTGVLFLATKNRGKTAELRDLLRDLADLDLLTQADRDFADVEETGGTFLANALLKAEAASAATGLPVLAEDAGLEVDHLGGAPGVRSARFSGEPVDFARNNAILLERLRDVRDRRARFVAVAVLRLPDGRTFTSSGTLEGSIAETPRGTGGFGYDPLFVPRGETRTLAEMATGEKNEISHRRRAIEGMQPILRDLLAQGALARRG